VRRESGQATVEAALVMPVMVCLALCILQLSALQQARILTEYAAFCAARVGVVWSGSNERMHDAAMVALLPTLGRTESLGRLSETWQTAQALDERLQRALISGLEKKLPPVFEAANLLGMVRVDTLNPAGYAELGSIWNLRGGAAWKELDLDGPDSFPEAPGLERHLPRFYDLSREDPSQVAYRRATVLSIRVRYLYEMRVPLANWLLFACWVAARSGVELEGPLDRTTGEGLGKGAPGIHVEQGLATVTAREMQILWRLASGGAGARRFFIPLTATYRMRMQSNFHRKWLMHEEPGWGL
jgi:hypothetical protein